MNSKNSCIGYENESIVIVLAVILSTPNLRGREQFLRSIFIPQEGATCHAHPLRQVSCLWESTIVLQALSSSCLTIAFNPSLSS